jgi:multiple sugar transport system substrate-binding protein
MTTGEGGTTWFKATGKGLGTDNIVATEEFKSNRFQSVAADSLNFCGGTAADGHPDRIHQQYLVKYKQQALLGQISAEEALGIMQKSLHGE